jgi:HPt (histidine-containing phosphotransfer) domain-containing protein
LDAATATLQGLAYLASYTQQTLQNDEYYSKLEPLVKALHEEVPDAKYDAKTLAYTLVQILHFQEAALGKDVSA